MQDNVDKTEGVFVADTARVVGDVKIGKNCSIWYGAVIRGDEAPIQIGRNTNVQDNCVIHADKGFDVEIGADVTIGHGSIVHGCRIGAGSLIGMGAIILNGAVIGKDCLIGAGALVTGRSNIPDKSLVIGSPARVKRSLTEDEIREQHKNIEMYVHMENDCLHTER